MEFRDKFEHFKRQLRERHLYTIALVALAIIAATSVYQFKRGQDLTQTIENNYNRAFIEMVTEMRDLNTNLSKGLLVNSPAQLAHFSNEIYRQSASAKANLGQLPLTYVELDKTNKFLAQIADYTYSISQKAVKGQKSTQEEQKNLKELSGYANRLYESLSKMQNDLMDGKFTISSLEKQASEHMPKEGDNKLDGINIGNVEKEFDEYPSLIYDGPFSDHMDTSEPSLIKDEKKLTSADAMVKVVEFLGKDYAREVVFVGEDKGKIPSYTYNAYPDPKNKKRNINIGITIQGGEVLWAIDNKSTGAKTLSFEEANKKAEEFLISRGYENMQTSYYETTDNIATINYAYKQGDVILYSDLIKVKVALDDGEIMGFEASGYINNHTKRNISAPKLSAQEAADVLNPNLQVKATQMAFIPTDFKTEILCYEFKGSFEKNNFLVYINANTGAEEKILILIESETGVLTI